ncbi:MAG: S-methyl-5-thioribose-1-phosphate isomerase [Clostridia bacterium]|nr:S-methyl-5-thioribose-1-phosphate isomerase [Clostridia bacterium]
MQPLKWQEGKLVLLDQTLLPSRLEYCACQDYLEVAEAIKMMKVRGAPAIGVSAAYGIVLAALAYQGEDKTEFLQVLEEARAVLAKTRPTAVNLFWALERMKRRWAQNSTCMIPEIQKILAEEAQRILEEDLQANKQIGVYGSKLIPQEATILTHCNAGALATAGFGTALGVIRTAYQEGKKIQVYVDETRPLLQGARLTAWELLQEGIPVTLIADNMAGCLLQQGKIDLVIVGADRIAANGDVANKIGTYSVAVLAHYHQVPFYVAAPLATFDLSLSTGEKIPIEERDAEEMRKWGEYQLAPQDVPVYNPAFDVTPSPLVTALITEKGIIRPPFAAGIQRLFSI